MNSMNSSNSMRTFEKTRMRVTPPVTIKFLAGKQILIADTPLPATIAHSVVQSSTLLTVLFIDTQECLTQQNLFSKCEPIFGENC